MMRYVYGIYNYTRKERYYGTTEGSVRYRMEQHRRGYTRALQRWDWEKDRIIYKTIARLPETRAIQRAHRLETTPPHHQDGGLYRQAGDEKAAKSN